MKDIYNSPRFWLLVVASVLQVLVVFNVIDSVQLEALTHIVQMFLVGIVAVRTVDRTGDKKVEAAIVAKSI